MRSLADFAEAATTSDVERFLDLMYPPEWGGIRARVLETGVTIAAGDEPCPWAPRWSKIPMVRKRADDTLIGHVKSTIFRFHDTLHQLWGLPHPRGFTEDDFYYYKRGQMCGEVAVLTITEFAFCAWLSTEYPEVAPFIESRNALPLLRSHLYGKTLAEIAARMDDLMHKKSRPRWVREDPVALAFVEDYVPMLERDRQQIDHNWQVMKAAGWSPGLAPKARFGSSLDGLELTLWMIRDFEHLLTSSPDVDRGLMDFNRERRGRLVLPAGWVS